MQAKNLNQKNGLGFPWRKGWDTSPLHFDGEAEPMGSNMTTTFATKIPTLGFGGVSHYRSNRVAEITLFVILSL